MSRRAVRVPDVLWAAAQAKADENGEYLSEVIRAALESYVQSTARTSHVPAQGDDLVFLVGRANGSVINVSPFTREEVS